jgi:DNA-binding transcriptional MerR regulator
MNETRSITHMTIGEFARQTRLTQKALRLYDALGLLEPRFTDPQSGYRYYAADQLERAQLIAWLRQLEMPLNRIAGVLELSQDSAAQEIATYWREVKADMRERENLVVYLVQRLEGKGYDMFKIETRHVGERKMAWIEKRIFQPEISGFIGVSMDALYAHIGASDLKLDGAPFVIYHGKVDKDSDAVVEVCVPFTGSLEPTAEIRVRVEPAHDEAFTVMTKGSVKGPELMHGYDALDAWLKQNGKSSILGCREVYFADWNAVTDDQFAFDIAAPFA